ncbi:hypothetical protein M430DRAFT_66136 [Amorphotheca resinae ATCC 22711]|uniref:Uncharacterized protein n=1 Tax=Amorphotheca resinae ATCC 22711 TaxID=857342 RepID=A0A2T3B487_AMORE|nr:hypothetical protein M430DRAFT_66136 [Amorphotheca resinae ATCC 22711]PSS20441.1 hypothetical protein M430DRAFT_66136 [Amorphotheca resinae ATCC 22711]
MPCPVSAGRWEFPLHYRGKHGSMIFFRRPRSKKSKLFIRDISTWKTSDRRTQQSSACQFSNDSRFSNLPGVQNNNEHSVEGSYLAVLTPAWAYIISANWAET